MHIFSIINNLRFQDVLDVLFLSVVAYYLFLWFRGTKAFKALIGLLVLGIIYTLARSWGLFLTTWAFQIFWQVLVILIIILFQSEIRQVLERVNPIQTIALRRTSRPEEWIQGLVQAIFNLAKLKIGALIVLERLDFVEELVTGGQPLEGAPTHEILMSIFQKESPLHDGAVLIRRGRITHVACYLPLSSAEKLPQKWGTRHRAALGLSERSDALVVVVSEERGDVSVARETQILHVESLPKLSQIVTEATGPFSPVKKTWDEKIGALLAHRWKPKLASFALVSLLWVLFAGQQDFEVSFPIPLKIKNAPPHMVILDPVNPRVQITVEGIRKDASTLDEENVYAEIDLSQAGSGKRIFSVSRDQVRLPSDRVDIVNIKPNQIEFKFKEDTGETNN